MNWRHLALIGGLAIPLVALVFSAPILQPERYHQFADTRTMLGIPNAMDVLSNIPFAVVGLLGIRWVMSRPAGPASAAWLTLFLGMGLVSVGSANYHWNPSDETLLWDRIPISIGFMSLLSVLITEHVHARTGQMLLVPATVTGLCSVALWYITGDLSLYVWVQVAPLLAIPLVLYLFARPYSHARLLLAALILYALAKAAEVGDRWTYELMNQAVSGHTMKHLFAAAACVCLYWMLRNRAPISPRSNPPTVA